MVPIMTPDEVRAVDAAAPEPVEELIDRAGRAVARAAIDMLGGTYGRRVVVIAGGGNNGADGRSAATYLRTRGVQVRVVDAAMRPPILPRADLVIDAAFGTGFRGEWIAPEIDAPAVLAVDIPSGVDALTGEARGRVLAATRTITFQVLKPGLLFGDGARLSGEVTVADIGLDVSSAACNRVDAADVEAWWPRRDAGAHKWHGAVRVVAGSAGMPGAGQLCAEAAARAGAGLVSLSSPGTTPRTRAEIVTPSLDETCWAETVLVDIHRFGALVVGPGLGRDEPMIESIRRVIADATVPVVIDGDGIFAAAWSADGPAPLLRERELPTVITPHDGEYALLTGAPPGPDRIAATRDLAAQLDCTVLLKGPTTVVASPGDDPLVVDHGDERLATAGTGDVLAGMIGAALARGADATPAAAASAWLHADAARRGPAAGLLAGDVIERLPESLEAMR